MFNSIRNLFRPKKLEHTPASLPIETAPLSRESSPKEAKEPNLKISPPQLIVGTAQSVGIQRDHNEDTLYALSTVLADGNSDLPFGLFIVADGMGGHLNGEIASGSAAKTMGDYLLTHFYLPFLSGQPRSEGESIHEVMENGVREAHRSVVNTAPGGGTTLTAAMVIGDQVTVSHVGDTRAYFMFPDGEMQVVTQDHSLVRRLQDLGQIDEKEASIHPQRNVLYRALGQSDPFRPDINTHTLPGAGYMLLCSDGLWGSVPDEEINEIVRSASSPVIACQKLIDAANANGGPDNISAILVQYLS